MSHQAQFSEPILNMLRILIGSMIEPPALVFDPFAGEGTRLGRVCDRLRVRFAGMDLEDWPGHDERIYQANAVDQENYPTEPFLVATSPAYPNGMADHFVPKDTSKRYTYRSALGRDLHPDNMGRYNLRKGKRAMEIYWSIARSAVDCWAECKADAIVNVKDVPVPGTHGKEMYPLADEWATMMADYGYRVTQRLQIPVVSMRNGANREARTGHEDILVARLR